MELNLLSMVQICGILSKNFYEVEKWIIFSLAFGFSLMNCFDRRDGVVTRRDGVVVRASASQAVDLGFIFPNRVILKSFKKCYS